MTGVLIRKIVDFVEDTLVEGVAPRLFRFAWPPARR